jgi:peptidyl-prolyl cis-trans isomerase C
MIKMKKFAIPAFAAVAIAGVVGVAITMEKDVVTVNGVGVSKETVDLHMATIPANLLEGKEAIIRQSVVERLIEQELVMQDSVKEKIENNAEFQKGMNALTRNYTYTFMINQAVGSRVTEENVAEVYAKNKENLRQETVKARHILVKDEATALALITKLQNGADFSKTAETESTGPSAKTGGDLGYFRKGDMVPAFADAAFSMQPGDMSKEPVKTQFGYHIIKIEDRKMAAAPTLDSLRAGLKQQLTQAGVRDYLAGLRETAKIDYANKPVAAKTASEKALEAVKAADAK